MMRRQLLNLKRWQDSRQGKERLTEESFNEPAKRAERVLAPGEGCRAWGQRHQY